jgi:hypothetical protein
VSLAAFIVPLSLRDSPCATQARTLTTRLRWGWSRLVLSHESPVDPILPRPHPPALARGQAVERDERDHAIEARANQNERLFIIVAVNVLIWQALWEGLLGAHSFPRIDITRLPAVVFLLFALLFGGEMVKRVSTIWLYRAQTPRD